MGTGYTRNDTANNIADGNVINAADFDGEYDAIEAAFNSSTGHTHDGTSAEGAPITVLGPSQEFVASSSEVKPSTNAGLDLGTSSLKFKDLYIDGVAYIDGFGGDILAATDKKIQFRDTALFINSSADGQLDIDADTTIELNSPEVIVTDDFRLQSDAAILTFGADDDVSVTHVADTGLDAKAASGFNLKLQTGDTTVEDTNTIGKISFNAPDEASGTDAILVGAEIEAAAEATFSSTVNSTALVFKTNDSAAATERFRIKSNGDIIIKGDSYDVTWDASADAFITDSNNDIKFQPHGTGAVAVTGALTVDNIKIDGNTISSTDTNGNINITPDGTGQVVVGGGFVPSEIALTSTDGGATKGPKLDIFRDSASPADGDAIGYIDFSGDDSGNNKTVYASILATAVDVTDTTEDGKLEFNTMVDGSDTTITTMDADGVDITGTVKGDKLVIDTPSSGAAFEVNLIDNQADNFVVQQGSNKYINITTANTAEKVILGNESTTPELGINYNTPNTFGSGFTGIQTGGTTGTVFSAKSRNYFGSNIYNDGSWKYVGAGLYAPMAVWDANTGDTNFYTTASGAADSAISFIPAITIEQGQDGVVINQNGEDRDFRVEGDSNTHMLFVDAGNDRLKVGGSNTDGAAIMSVFDDRDNSASNWYSDRTGLELYNYSQPAGYGTSVGILLEAHSGENVYMYSEAPSNGNVTGYIGARITSTNNRDMISWTPTSVTINDDSYDADFRVESNGDANALYVDGGSDFVAVGTNNPSYSGKFNVYSGTNTQCATFESALGGAGAAATIRLGVSTRSASGLVIGSNGSSATVNGGSLAAYMYNSEASVLNLGGGNTFQLELGTSEVVVNENGANTDFRVESDSNSTALVVDAAADGGAGIIVFGNGSASVLNNGGYFTNNSNNAHFVVTNTQTSNVTANIYCNRQGSDGTLMEFRQANSAEGSISVSGSTVSYNGFSGRHESSGIPTTTARGTVVSTIDELDEYLSGTKQGQTRADHAKVEVSDSVGDPCVYGVVDDYTDDGSVNVISVGIAAVRVTGACAKGDLLESNGDGTAKVQSDDIIRSKTIGKVTIGNSDTGVKLVSCVMYCG